MARLASARRRRPTPCPRARRGAGGRRGAGERRAGESPVLLPVPLHPLRGRQRGGLNAAEALAREVGARLELGVSLAMERPRDNVPQSGLGRKARLENAERSFALSRPEEVFGSAVVLVDDVLTTGATATA